MMQDLSPYIERIRMLDAAVVRTPYFQGDVFRTTLCGLIRDIPPQWTSSARELCEAETCPLSHELVLHLQDDIDSHPDEMELSLVLFPLLRVAIAIRAGEITSFPKA